VLAHESDPLIVQIVAGSEMVILVAFEAHLGETTGTINLCMPLLVLNPLLEKISAQSKYTVAAPAERMSKANTVRVRSAVARAVVPVAVNLGETMLPVRDLVNLRTGDIIELSTTIGSDVQVLVGTESKFLAKPGKVGDKTAVQICGYHE
jgi:flagellar motor switch protein FliM